MNKFVIMQIKNICLDVKNYFFVHWDVRLGAVLRRSKWHVELHTTYDVQQETLKRIIKNFP